MTGNDYRQFKIAEERAVQLGLILTVVYDSFSLKQNKKHGTDLGRFQTLEQLTYYLYGYDAGLHTINETTKTDKVPNRKNGRASRGKVQNTTESVVVAMVDGLARGLT